MFGWLINLMEESLTFLYEYVNNYGLAIILFTLIIKFLLYPLTAKQTRSMKAMQDLQPEMEKIKEKYKDDKEKQQQEIMSLYRENNVNPAAGCLPMILQLAILIPLYRAILGMEEVMGEATFLWIGSLAEPDKAIVIVNAVAMFAQVHITSKISGSSKNSTFTYIMPLFILFIGFQIPSGVLLYWLTSTIFTGIQQYYLNKEGETEEVVEQNG
ncbi:MAG: YidC/Oxa1 family membrane protein insertase [Halanaerobiales bacterium]